MLRTAGERNREGERRATARLAAERPVSLLWHGLQGEVHRTRGLLRNVSLQGLYCYAEQALPVGTPVHCHFVLPGELLAGVPITVTCSGTILRSEKTSDGQGVAILIEPRQILQMSFPTNEAENRLSHRVRPLAALLATYSGVTASVGDLSLDGAFVETPQPLALGQTFPLRISSPELPPGLDVQVVVRRVDPGQGMAVEFLSLTEEGYRRLRKLLEDWSAAPGREKLLDTAKFQLAAGLDSQTQRDSIKLIRQCAARLLPRVQTVDCCYEQQYGAYLLFLLESETGATFTLPIGENWVDRCRTSSDLEPLERAVRMAGSLVTLSAPTPKDH